VQNPWMSWLSAWGGLGIHFHWRSLWFKTGVSGHIFPFLGCCGRSFGVLEGRSCCRRSLNQRNGGENSSQCDDQSFCFWQGTTQFLLLQVTQFQSKHCHLMEGLGFPTTQVWLFFSSQTCSPTQHEHMSSGGPWESLHLCQDQQMFCVL